MSVPTDAEIDPPEAERRADSPRMERLAAWVLGRPISAMLGILCLGWLASWIPNYLTWPWFADLDVFATAAQAWDAGLLPYRDLRANNFPGTTYGFWILGRLFGWGWTAPFYAVDATFVVVFGALLVAWSVRRLGRALPGLVGYAMFLGYYLALDYSQVAQRDWQGPFFAASGLLIVQAWPGRLGRVVGAAALATAMVVRPQVILFAPAYVLAIDEGIRPVGGRPWRTIGAALEWALVTAAVLALEFLPLVRAGLWGSFQESLRLVAPGGSYNTLGVGTFFKQMANQLMPLRIAIVPVGIALLVGRADSPTRRLARTWLVTLALVLFHGPLTPHVHTYLIHPLMVVWCVCVAVLAHLVVREHGLRASVRLLTVLLIVGLGVSIRPRFSNPRASLKALPTLGRGAMPGPSPNGYTSNIGVPAAAHYPWADYRALIEYVRAEVGPETRVANALLNVPAVTGPTARLPAFPAESIAWVIIVNPQAEPDFADALRAANDSVVVWAPEEHDPLKPELPTIVDAIESLYEPEARFGMIEVWRRKRSRPEDGPSSR